MRHLRRTVLVAVAAALFAVPAAAGNDAHPGGEAKVAPVGKVAGLTGGELLRESWKQVLSLPVDNRFLGHCLPLVEGKVLMPLPADDGTAICRANRGTPLFLRFGSECSNVEDLPYFGADEAAQQACARASDEGFQAMRITVDNGPTIDVHTSRFELLSPQGRVRLPANNFLGVRPQTATFAAHAWGGVVSGLRPGQHTITFEIVHPEFAFTITTTLNVV